MAEEIDRKIMPDFLQQTFCISLGACYKSFEMMKKPQDSMNAMLTNMKEMFTVQKDAGDGLQKKAEAVAAVWMDKGMTLMQTCRETGEKFTEAK